MEGYPSNPNQVQLPDGDKKLTKGKGTEVKKSRFSKMLEMMIDEDLPSLKKYVVVNVLLPRIGKVLLDIFGLGQNTPVPPVDVSGKTDYNKISSQEVRVVGSSNMTQPYKDEVSKRYSFKQLGYGSQREAQDVLDQLRDDIQRYKMATLLHYYEYSDIDTESTENNYGWKNLDNAEVYFDRTSMLWIIKLPKVQLLG